MIIAVALCDVSLQCIAVFGTVGKYTFSTFIHKLVFTDCCRESRPLHVTLVFFELSCLLSSCAWCSDFCHVEYFSCFMSYLLPLIQSSLTSLIIKTLLENLRQDPHPEIMAKILAGNLRPRARLSKLNSSALET